MSVKPISKYINSLDVELTSDEYHSLGGTYSSSQLKTALKDMELFYRKYITKELEKETGSQFDIGTYFHTAVLEPHKLDEECAVYSDGKRIGAKWNEFQEKHKGKAIITSSELEKANGIIKAVQSSKIAMGVLNECNNEVSAFIEVFITDGIIYSCKNGKIFYLNLCHGWTQTEVIDEDTIREFSTRLVLKVRADAIHFVERRIADLKSTGGNAKDQREMRNKISDYDYDLSASFYLDVFSFVTDSDFQIFDWIFASKDMFNCKTWRATYSNVVVGRAKWATAVINIAKYVNNNWKFEDELGFLEPNMYEKEWLDKAETHKDLTM